MTWQVTLQEGFGVQTVIVWDHTDVTLCQDPKDGLAYFVPLPSATTFNKPLLSAFHY